VRALEVYKVTGMPISELQKIGAAWQMNLMCGYFAWM